VESNDGSLFTSTETLGSIGRLEDAFEKFVRSHFTGREGGMTTVWRPRVRIAVPDIDGADADENRRDELTKKGTKRKIAPSTPRAVRARGEVPLELQGVQCLSARSSALSVQGVRWVMESASTVVCALRCKECGGGSICEHGRRRSRCKECGGSQICEHGRERTARSAVGDQHGRVRSKCKECKK
jgi:hypothetical protein